MDYSEARTAFFAEWQGPAEELGWTTPARRLRDAMEPIPALSFWAQPVHDAYVGPGMDFLQGYVWGRASTLGEPEPSVAAAGFGVRADSHR